MKLSSPRRPRLFLAGFLALAAIAAGASGCSSSDEGSRQAAGHLGTRVCIINYWTDTVSVQFTTKDTETGSGPLGPNRTFCAEGTSSLTFDVVGKLVFPKPARALAFVSDSTAGSFYLPSLDLGQFEVNDPQRAPIAAGCIKSDGYKVGDDGIWDNGIIRVTITRWPDDQWREYNLVIKPSQGERIGDDPCLGYWG
jgi:hypothetical protein